MVDCRRFVPRVDGTRIANPSNIETSILLLNIRVQLPLLAFLKTEN